MLMKTNHRTAKSALILTALACISACDSAGQPPTTVDSEVAGSSNEPIFADASGTTPSRLVTGNSSEPDLSRWFCSFYTEEKFLSRSAINLYSDSSGAVNNIAMVWEAPDEQSLRMVSEDWIIELENLRFSERTSVNDKFDATIGDHSFVSCDWSGASRVGSILLSDGSSSEELVDYQATSEPENEIEVERLLITALNEDEYNAVWRCEYKNDDVTFDYQEYYFYPGNRGLAALDFEWAAISDNAIQLIYPDAEFSISDITFLDEEFYRFTARDSREFDLVCEWSGTKRASDSSN